MSKFSLAFRLRPILVWLGWWGSVELANIECQFSLAWLVALVSFPFNGISAFSAEILMGNSPRERKLKSPPMRCIELPRSSFWACRFHWRSGWRLFLAVFVEFEVVY